MEVVASLSRCCKSEARQWLSGRVFVGRASCEVFLVPGVVLLSPTTCPDPTCRHPSAAMGKTAMHRHLNTFCLLHRGFLVATCVHFQKDTCGYFRALVPIHPAGGVTDRQEQGGGEWLTHKVAEADKKQITGCIPIPNRPPWQSSLVGQMSSLLYCGSWNATDVKV